MLRAVRKQSSIRFYCTPPPVQGSQLLEMLRTLPKKRFEEVVPTKRNQRKIRIAKYIPNSVTLHVLGSGARGTLSSLYVTTTHNRYLFNCGESAQRLANEHHLKLSRMENIFFTQAIWRYIGGMPGTALTLQDVGVELLNLHGPPGLSEVFTATKKFIVLTKLKINEVPCIDGGCFEDESIRIQYVPLVHQLNNTVNNNNNEGGNVELPIEDDSTDYYAHEFGRRKSDSSSIDKLSQLLKTKKRKIDQVAFSYICRLTSKPGTLDLDACVRKGVPPGPLLGQLKCGTDVTLPDGSVVRSSDVCSPVDPGSVFIVVDCPTLNHLQMLLNSEPFFKHQHHLSAPDPVDVPKVVVHFTQPEIAHHTDYTAWMERFPATTQHMFLNEANLCTGSAGVYRHQYKLNLLSDRIFPLLQDDGVVMAQSCGMYIPCTSLAKRKFEEMSSPESALTFVTDDRHVIQPNTMYQYHLRPKYGGNATNEVKLEPSLYVDEVNCVANTETALDELHRKHDAYYEALTSSSSSNEDHQQPFCLFLGTGSSIPNKTRNTSAIWLQTDTDKHMLLDCGEGTFAQMLRFWGRHHIDTKLVQLRAIYLSHLHADHHIGLLGVLQERRRAFHRLGLSPKPLILFAPEQIKSWLHFYHNHYEPLADTYELCSNKHLLMKAHTLNRVEEVDMFERVGVREMSTCLVRHCPHAYGACVVTQLGGYRVTYSGDTIPTQRLVQLGLDSDLLIHEATMEDNMETEARGKLHSTTRQAITMGREMRAKFTLLTHFSQRYAKMPYINDSFDERVGVAFDFMKVHFKDLPALPMMNDALKTVFADFYELIEKNQKKRHYRVERIQRYEKTLAEQIKQPSS